MVYPNNSIKDLQFFIKELKKFNFRVFFLSGEIGSGKTTLVKKYCLENNVYSPTYTIHNEISHEVSHFDLYRCSTMPIELAVCLLEKKVFIEWWEKFPFELYEKYLCPKEYCFINMGSNIDLNF
jgi:tRNA threonylcarbamoyl adenosine modification protein YjeE